VSAAPAPLLVPQDPAALLAAKHGLSYQVPYVLAAEAAIGLRGKRVLEVGGTLPAGLVLDDLGVERWIGVEAREPFTEEYRLTTEAIPDHAPVRKLRGFSEPASLARYEVLDGFIEDLPPALEGQFDAIFSIACFEHILRFPSALDSMYRALRPGGKLFTRFAPIWSSHDGHHLPPVVDKAGQRFDFSRSPIPPWGHLLLRPPQLYRHLLQFTDPEAASAMVYFTHQSSVLNRLFVEDYVDYVQQSRFKAEVFQLIYLINVPPPHQQELERLHPGRRFFANNGIELVLVRPE
jgi:SAM-dependent methyltransferase